MSIMPQDPDGKLDPPEPCACGHDETEHDYPTGCVHCGRCWEYIPRSTYVPTPQPKRIQRRRSKGWRMPEGAVYVGRPTAWGNPWVVGDHALVTWPYDSVTDTQHVRQVVITPALAVELYRQAFAPDTPEARAELGGRDLACWCPLDQPCHADVLLEMANAR